MNEQCIIHTDLVQGSDEWFDLRKGVCTGSEASKGLLAAKKGHATYRLQKEAELHLQIMEPGYSNSAMERGTELEPLARDEFKQQMLLPVEEVGFIHRPDLNAGFSPDGLIPLVTRSPHQLYHGIEIKCRNAVNHYRVFKEGIDQPTYEQIQFGMAITGIEKFYFVAYNPDFNPEYQMYIEEVLRDDELSEAMIELLLSIKEEIGA